MLSTCCTFTRVVRVFAPLLGPLRGRNCCCLWFWQVVLVFHCELPRQISPLPRIPSLKPGPTLVDMVTTGFPNPVVTISTRVGPGSRLPGSPNPLSNRRVLHDWRKHTRPSTFHNPMLSTNKHVVRPAVPSNRLPCRLFRLSVEPCLSLAFKDRSVVPWS